ncbi:MAG: polysaccharide lyase [Chitinivibrionales bacterium]
MNLMHRQPLLLPLIIFLASYTNFAQQGEPGSLETMIKNRNDIVFYGGFEEISVNSTDWKNAWGIPFVNRGDQVEILSGPEAFIGNKTLRIDYPRGGVGPSATGMQFPVDFKNMDAMPQKTYDSLYLRYYVKFEDGFDFRLGGKLPGLMGGNQSWKRSGGDQPDGTNGWTLRFMWREGGEAVVYAYLPTGTKYNTSRWGTDIKLNRQFNPGSWHCIEQFCKVNTIGQEDGKLYVWLDGERVLTLQDVTYRTIDNDAGRIGGFFFSTFHGGNTPEWGPRVTSYAQFDGIVAATSRVGTHE